MKKLLTLLILIFSCNSFAQVVTFEDIDEFTGTHSVLVKNSKDKEISIENDDIVIDSQDRLFMSVDINVAKNKIDTLTRFILAIVSSESKCYRDSKLYLLYESGEVLTLPQETKSTCDAVATVGYRLSDKDFALAKNKLIKKIRLTHTEGQNDYTISPEQQVNLQKTLKLAFNKLQEMKK